MLESLNAIAGILTLIVFLFLEWPRLTSRFGEILGPRAGLDRRDTPPHHQGSSGPAHSQADRDLRGSQDYRPADRLAALPDVLLPIGVIVLVLGWLSSLDLMISLGLLCVGVGAVYFYVHKARQTYGRASLLVLALGVANILIALAGPFIG